MKKTILIGMMIFCAGSMFAQKSNVNKALSATMREGTWKSADVDEAKALINPALEHPETANEAKTWYTAGMVSFKEYEAELEKSLRGKTDDNEVKKGRIVLTSLDYFIKADELDAQPDAKGKVKPRYRDETREIIKNHYRRALIDYGVHSYNKNDMRSAVRAFEAYLNIPNLPMMKGDKDVQGDTLIAIIREYHEDATIRQASNQLAEKKDTTAYYKTIRAAFDKNPDSRLFLTTLIDFYTIMRPDTNKALELLDKAIAREPDNMVFYLIKAQVLGRDGQSDAAYAAFARVVELAPDRTEGYAGQASVFITNAERLREEANAIQDVKRYNAKVEEAVAQYAKAIPYLEKVRSLNPNDINNLQILRQVYYNVEGESDNFKKISAELEALR